MPQRRYCCLSLISVAAAFCAGVPYPRGPVPAGWASGSAACAASRRRATRTAGALVGSNARVSRWRGVGFFSPGSQGLISQPLADRSIVSWIPMLGRTAGAHTWARDSTRRWRCKVGVKAASAEEAARGQHPAVRARQQAAANAARWRGSRGERVPVPVCGHVGIRQDDVPAALSRKPWGGRSGQDSGADARGAGCGRRPGLRAGAYRQRGFRNALHRDFRDFPARGARSACQRPARLSGKGVFRIGGDLLCCHERAVPGTAQDRRGVTRAARDGEKVGAMLRAAGVRRRGSADDGVRATVRARAAHADQRIRFRPGMNKRLQDIPTRNEPGHRAARAPTCV